MATALFLLAAAAAAEASPEAAEPSPSPSPLRPLRPSLTVVAGVLAGVFSLTFLLLLYFKHCKNGGSRSTTDLYSYSSWPRDSGVDRAVVESLPVFRFGALLGHKDGLECAVCLARFEAAEALRLLPKCRHAFHVECVDTWLDAHSSCPLCRSRVHPEDILLLPPPAAPPPELTGRRSRGGADADVSSSGRRVSGRHSSAGEKSTKSLLRVVVDRAADNTKDTRSRRSVDYAAGVEKERKDVLLPTSAAKDDTLERRFGHQIVVERGGDAGQERWSDLRPSDLLFLKSEMIITDSGRFSASRVGGYLSGGERSVSEITGVCRHPRREEEDRTMRRWLGFAATRTARWLRGGERGGGGSSNSNVP